jgi:hypothetical protein
MSVNMAGYSVIIMDNQVSLETTGYPSLSGIADALTRCAVWAS